MLRLVHGWGLNAAVFARFVRAWGGPATAIDLPGHGHAPWQPGALMPVTCADQWARCYPDAATWLGWSLGALPVLLLAARHPHCVQRLVLVAATPRFVVGPGWPSALPLAALTTFATDMAADPEATVRRFLLLQAGLTDRALARRLMTDLKDGGMAAAAALEEGLRVLATTDLRVLLAGIGVPVLIIHGRRDRLVPLAAAQACAAAIPQAVLRVIGDGHAPFLTHEAACVTALRAFGRD